MEKDTLKCCLSLLGAALFCLLILPDASAAEQALPPELAPLAAKFEADNAVITAARETALAKVREGYLADLATAERSATGGGRVKEVAAIFQVREAVAGGAPDPRAPADFPKSLERRHSTYLAALATVEREYAPRYQKTAADLLRVLGTMETRAAAGSPLRTASAELKSRVALGPAAKELVGVWEIRMSNWKGSRELFPDGSFSWEKGPKGRWTATGSELRLEYPAGKKPERFGLPPRNGEIVGSNSDGYTLIGRKK